MTETPYLAVNIARLDSNLQRMADWAAGRGLTMRPHAKTHKCAQLAARQISCGAAGLTVATIGEAEAFVDALPGRDENGGITELFIAYPLWLTEEKAARLRRLAERVSVRVGIDSAVGAARWGELLGSKVVIEAVVEVDSGHHRTGVAPNRAGDIAVAAAAAGLEVVGVFTFPGHGYGPGMARSDAAAQESRALATAAESLRARGFDPKVRSGGSTPTAAFADADILTEVRPGVYPFNDAQQLELGSCDVSEVALYAVATVIHRTDRRIVVDAGSKILGADCPPWAPGFGLCDPADLADPLGAGGLVPVVTLSEHHAVIDLPDDIPAERLPEPGTVVRVIPNHVCTAVNLVDELVAVDADGAMTAWPVVARGRN